MNLAYQVAELSQHVAIAFIDNKPQGQHKGIIVLIHGFPQTSYQFRQVISPLTAHGYRVLAPDYRGAGLSSKPASTEGSAFRKSVMADDIIALLDHLGISEPVHVVGTDIGGMVAFALASRHTERVCSLNWGECPLPGTSVYYSDRTEHAVQQFHHIFHCVPGLPEKLFDGNESNIRAYLEHFLKKITSNKDAITASDLDEYMRQYAKSDAMRCAFEVYRAFPLDAEENKDWIRRHGKVRVPTLGLSGAKSRHEPRAREMFAEMHEEGTYELATVENAAHYVSEENPQSFVEEIIRFIKTIG